MRSLLIVTTLLATVFLDSAEADIIISAPSVSASAGSSGNFDILLTNNGSSGVLIGAFSFAISTVSSKIDFTGASTNTTAAPYIYAGDSFAEIHGFPLATRTGQALTASDLPNTLECVLTCIGTVNGGMTVSLGEVFYTVARSATFRPVGITFSSAGTSLADLSGAPIPATTVNGQIALVPEPRQSPLVLVCLGVFVFALVRRQAGDRRA